MFECNKCGVIEDRTCSVEEKDKQLCKACGYDMRCLVEKKPQVTKYRERPEVRQWRKEKGI